METNNSVCILISVNLALLWENKVVKFIYQNTDAPRRRIKYSQHVKDYPEANTRTERQGHDPSYFFLLEINDWSSRKGSEKLAKRSPLQG